MDIVDCKTALKILESGIPIIFPTDTLPAIGCLPKFSNKIYELKKRDRGIIYRDTNGKLKWKCIPATDLSNGGWYYNSNI